MKPHLPSLLSLLALLVAGPAAAAPTGPMPPAPVIGPPTPAEAKRFADIVEQDLMRLTIQSSTAEWIKNTYIIDDTERAAAAANEVLLGYTAAAVRASSRFLGLKLDADTARKLHLLRVSSA